MFREGIVEYFPDIWTSDRVRGSLLENPRSGGSVTKSPAGCGAPSTGFPSAEGRHVIAWFRS